MFVLISKIFIDLAYYFPLILLHFSEIIVSNCSVFLIGCLFIYLYKITGTFIYIITKLIRILCKCFNFIFIEMLFYVMCSVYSQQLSYPHSHYVMKFGSAFIFIQFLLYFSLF